MTRPAIRLLGDELVDDILREARRVLDTVGVEVHHPEALALLAGHGARVSSDGRRVHVAEAVIDKALATAPRSFRLFDVLGNQTHDFSGSNVHFTPGSAALYILDPSTHEIRRPVSEDYVRYARLVSRLPHLAAQSTALIPSDVPGAISDSYRLYLGLLLCEKPVVTGTFSTASFAVMRDLQLAVRGGAEALAERPFTVFSCCATSPLTWSQLACQNVLDCARNAIPIEVISMPLAGFTSPVTLVGTLIQHVAEVLSGVVLGQLARPGSPVLFGGSPAPFDVRFETTPLGAVETMMMDCAYSQIGHRLGLPTQAYVSLSDSKRLDAQAGIETSMGAALAALAGINSVSGPGMLDFENCQSLEKLVVDNEVCGMALRLARGIEPREDFPATPILEELLRDRHLLVSKHSRRHLKAEHYMPGPVIDRTSPSRFQEEGGLTLEERARRQVEELIQRHEPSRLPDDVKRELTRLMEAEARRHGMDRLPHRWP